MTIEFNIGDEVYYGYPEPVAGVIAQIRITEDGVAYCMQGKTAFWKAVGKNKDEAMLRSLKADLDTHIRYIEQLKKEIQELERKMK